jgi:RNA polymerase sigma-70 factor (ECF subfamily)
VKLNAETPREEAIPALVEDYGDGLYNIGLRFCGDPHDAEDLVQEVFLQAFRAWDRFNGLSAPSTWLYKIAARVCQRRKRLRSGEPKHIPNISELLPNPADGVPDFADRDREDQLSEQVRLDEIARLEHAISHLPVPYRLPLVLKEIADFSLDEVAGVLGLKPQTVKTRVHRGRLLLRKALAEGMNTRHEEPPDHSRGACLDLLQLKQNALDQNVPFPLPDSELCSRCQALFQTMDLARNTCMLMRKGHMPPELSEMLRARFGAKPE